MKLYCKTTHLKLSRLLIVTAMSSYLPQVLAQDPPPPPSHLMSHTNSVMVATPATPLMFEEARKILTEGSPQLKASQKNLESKTLEQDAIKMLGGPIVMISGSAGHYDLSGGVSNDRLSDFDVIINGHEAPSIPEKHVPNVDLHAQVHDTFKFANANVIWPIYTGGKITAVKKFAQGKTNEAKADDRSHEAEVQNQLISRYFGAQLAQSAADLRQDAVNAIAVHDKTAQRMLDEGLIAKVERLQAKVALETAKIESEKASNDAILASVALQRLLQSERRISPATNLFINQKPLPELQYFLDLAMNKHPGLEKVAAKKEQATALHQAGQSRWKPEITAFAQHELNAKNPNRIAGLNLRWTLWSSVDRRQIDRANLATINAASYMDQQAREDISILVEKNWRDVENARYTYLSMNSNIQAAEEYLRLRQSGLREGLSTISDAIDAQVNLTKAKTERLQAANSYIQALAALLASAGIPEQFSQYLSTADTKVKP